MAEKVEHNNGIGFTGLLAVLFIGLKLTGYIDWSWWWVLSPLWLPLVAVLGLLLAVIIGIALFGGVGIGIAGVLDFFDGRRRRKRRG